ncbi:MAG: SURF1 family protein [Actinomycetes bacterium]
MLRFLIAPRRVAQHVLALVLVAAMIWLGNWQLQRALGSDDPSGVVDPAPVALERLSVPGQSLPGQAYGRRVTAQGRYDAGSGVLVVDRERRGVGGYWLLTPLRLQDGSGLAVVRGWVRRPAAASAHPPPSGEVTVTGRAYPSEEQAAGASAGPDRVGAAGPTEIAQDLPYRMRDGFVIATAEQPPPARVPAAVAARPWPSKADGFPLQNSAYAVQWWLFALFTAFMWWRIMREGWRRETGTAEPPTVDGDPDPHAEPDVPAGRPGALPR